MTTSAPCSIGRSRMGVATVLSTTNGDAISVRHSRQCFDVRDVSGRVAHALAENRPRVGIDDSVDGCGAVAFGKPYCNSEPREKVGKHRMRRAVELRYGNDIPARIG